jgi:hypothetical protein
MSKRLRLGLLLTLVIGAAVAALIGGLVYTLHPVCDPIDDKEAERANPPLEQRADEKDFYLQIFQKRNGHWYQCKTALSRWFFS